MPFTLGYWAIVKSPVIRLPELRNPGPTCLWCSTKKGSYAHSSFLRNVPLPLECLITQCFPLGVLVQAPPATTQLMSQNRYGQDSEKATEVSAPTVGMP